MIVPANLDTRIEVLDARLRPVIAGASPLQRLCTGARWSEGPVWISEDDSVLWSDIPNDRMLRWSESDGMSVWRQGVAFTNGHTRDHDGSLLHCSHGLRAVYRTRGDGPPEIVVDRFEGKRFNSPNDIVVRSDGSIWFTDPPYGIVIPEEGHLGVSELGDCFVFRYDPRRGSLGKVSDVAEEPNGLAFSPDESMLYVSDTSAALRHDGSGNHCIWVFDVVEAHDGAALANGRVFAVVSPGLADGFRLDHQGWIYTSSLDSVQVYHPDGALLGKIHVPEKIGNVTFGGAQRDWLYIAASTSLYRIRLSTRGIQLP
ncbi:MAG: SMP-30/gluconolactonase/LRE family protein [Betaproteobacteria bacterium]